MSLDLRTIQKFTIADVTGDVFLLVFQHVFGERATILVLLTTEITLVWSVVTVCFHVFAKIVPVYEE